MAGAMDTRPFIKLTHILASMIRLRPDRVALVLALMALGFALIDIIAFVTLGVEGADSHESFRQFDVRLEANFATYFQASVLALAAMTCWANAVIERGLSTTRWQRMLPGWRTLAAVFVFLSIDELAQIHENFNRVKPDFAGELTFVNHYSWVVVYLPFAACVGLAFIPFLLALPRKIAVVTFLSGVLYVLGAAGLEMVGAWQQTVAGFARDDLHTALRSVGEETMEVCAIILFVWNAMALVAEKQADLVIRIVKRDALQVTSGVATTISGH